MCEWGNYTLSVRIQSNVRPDRKQETANERKDDGESRAVKRDSQRRNNQSIIRETCKERDAKRRAGEQRQTAAWPFLSHPKAKSKPSMPMERHGGWGRAGGLEQNLNPPSGAQTVTSFFNWWLFNNARTLFPRRSTNKESERHENEVALPHCSSWQLLISATSGVRETEVMCFNSRRRGRLAVVCQPGEKWGFISAVAFRQEILLGLITLYGPKAALSPTASVAFLYLIMYLFNAGILLYENWLSMRKSWNASICQMSPYIQLW